MPSDVKATTADELRLRNYRTQLQRQHDLEVRELERKNADELQRLTEHSTTQLETLRQAYDVRISEEAESLEERLHQVRLNARERIAVEKEQAEEELRKTRTSHQQRLAEYKKNAEAQIDALRKQHQASAEAIHERSVKSAKRAERNSQA